MMNPNPFPSDDHPPPTVFLPGERPTEPGGLRWALRLLNVPGLARGGSYYVRKHLRSCDNVRFSPGFRCLYGNIFATDVSFNDTFFQDYADIQIGAGTAFSLQNLILTATHDLENDFRTILAKPVTIGRNVWITSRVTILGGVTIGDGSVIGAGSVVTGSIPPGVFAAGVPAKPIRSLKATDQSRTA
jgi:maltose O-acetyltransferase